MFFLRKTTILPDVQDGQNASSCTDREKEVFEYTELCLPGKLEKPFPGALVFSIDSSFH